MTPIPPHLLELTRRLIAYEANRTTTVTPRHQSTSKKTPPQQLASRLAVLDQLRPHLVTLMSHVGYQALLLRARALVESEHPWLSELTINADGTIATTAEARAQTASRRIAFVTSPENVRVGSHQFVAQVLTLLEAFIGEKLTLHLVTDVWPAVPLDKLDTARGEPLEKEH